MKRSIKKMIQEKITKEQLYTMDAVAIYNLVREGKYLKKFPAGFWMRPEAMDNAKKCIKYLVEEILNLEAEDLRNNLDASIFHKNQLCGMLNTCFEGSPYKAISYTYPEKSFQPWELGLAPRGYWKDIKNGIKATRWLVEKLQLTDEQIKEKWSVKLFKENGLDGMLRLCFNSSPFEAIANSFPEKKFQPWELDCVPNKYWKDIQNGVKATRWLVEKLNLTDEQLKQQLCSRLFYENGLGVMLDKCFNSSPYNAIVAAYPEKKYKKSDFESYQFATKFGKIQL